MPTMRVRDASDRAQFLAQRPAGVPIEVLRAPIMQGTVSDGVYKSVPAIELTYSFIAGEEQWVYQELRMARGSGSRVDLNDTLWAELEKSDDDYRLLRASGSF
jgi:hypothetical protein